MIIGPDLAEINPLGMIQISAQSEHLKKIVSADASADTPADII